MWVSLGSCNGLCGLGLGRLGSSFLLLGVSALEDCASLADDSAEHRCLLDEGEGGLVHNHTQVIALGREDRLLDGRLDAGSAQAQALVQNDGLVQIALGVGLVDDVALEVLREVALRTDAAVRLCAVEDDDLELVGESLTLTEVCQHHGEYGHHDVLGLGGFHTVNCEEFGGRYEVALNAHLTLVQEHSCIGGYIVRAEDAVGNVELDVVVGGVILCHNCFDLATFPRLLVNTHTPPSVCLCVCDENFVALL